MSHELEYVNSEATISYIGDIPWHGLGQNMPMGASSTEMMNAAHLNWTVSKTPVFYYDNEGNKQETNRSALIRSSDQKMLDMVSNDWNPVQNKQAFDFFNEFVADNSMYIETCGSLKNGKYVWAMAHVNDGFTLFNEDEVKGYLLFTNPHQYGKSIDIRFTAIRVVCNNTLTMALGEVSKNVFKSSHRNVFDAEKAKQILGLSHRKLDAYKERASYLSTKFYNSEDVVEYFTRVFPAISKEAKNMSRAANKAMDLLDTQPGAQYGKGTYWQLFNAVTYYIDHSAGRSQDNRVFSSWLGSGSDKKLEALKIALELA